MRLTIRNFLFALPAMALGLMLATALPANAAPKWQGFYLGVHGGAGIMLAETTNDAIGDCFGDCDDFFGQISATNDSIGDAGLIYGAQIGYDHMLGKKFLVGIQLSGSWGSLQGESSMSSLRLLPGPIGTVFDEMKVENESRYSASLRVGGLVNPNTLLYLVGGWSQAKMEMEGITFSGTNFGGPDVISLQDSSEDVSGWHAGLGLETKLTDNISLSVEYRYYAFDSISSSFLVSGGCCVFGGEMEADPSVHTATLGINYKF